MEVDYGGFSIREYTRSIRSVEVRKCWPFAGEITEDLIQSLLPPITVAKFRWWSHELASLLTESPVPVEDSDPPFKRKAKAKSRPCKKRSIVEICAAPPKIQLARKEDTLIVSDDLIGSKRKRTKDLVVQKKTESKKSKSSRDQKFANKCIQVNKCKEHDRKKGVGEKCGLGVEESSLSSKKAGSVSLYLGSEFQIPAILKAKRKVCFVKSPDKSKAYAPQCERHHVTFSDQSGNLSQRKDNTDSLKLCCVEMNRLSLSSSEDQSPVEEKQVKVMLNDQTSVVMRLESRQQDKFQPVISDRQLSHTQAKPDLSCFHGPRISLQEDASDLEEKEHVTSSESPYRSFSSFSQPASADMHSETLLYQSPFDPVLVKWMQKSVTYSQRHVGEAISGFPLNLQGEIGSANGEGCRSFDRSGLLCSGSTKSTSSETDYLLGNLVDFSSEKKHSTEPALSKDGASSFPMHNEKRLRYFPARLGLDETFTEKSFFTNTSDGECAHIVHSPVSEVNPRSHTINMLKQNGLNQNLNNGNGISKYDGLCLQNTQATMRLMGKDVSVGTTYSGIVRKGERIVAPDASIDYSSLGSHTHQSLLWRRTTLEVSENHSTTPLDNNNWNKAVLRDTSKDPFPLFCEPHVSLASQSRTKVVSNPELPHTILNPCSSLASFPLSDKYLNFRGYGLGLSNSFKFSQQQLLPLPPYYKNVDIGLLPDARKPYFGSLISCTDSTGRSQAPWPQSSFASSCSGMSFFNPAEQLVSLYGSKSSSYINVGTTNKRIASVEEYPMQNHIVPKLLMQDGLNSAKEFFAAQHIRKSQI